MFLARSRMRRDIGRVLLTALIVVWSVPTRATGQNTSAHIVNAGKPYEDPDAYAIYSILLSGYKDSTFVIQAETESYSGATSKNIGIRGDRTFRKVWGDAVKDYAKQYSNLNLLTRNISIGVPYELVSTERAQAIFKSGGWEEFYRTYPLSRGMYWFSAVGFDRQKTHGIVQMNYQCSGLCGKGEPHFFEKKDGKWHEVKVTATTTVWFS